MLVHHHALTLNKAALIKVILITIMKIKCMYHITFYYTRWPLLCIPIFAADDSSCIFFMQLLYRVINIVFNIYHVGVFVWYV